MINKIEKELISCAMAVSENARAKHSKFKVGAAILSKSGKIFIGCNIEFDNFSNTIHAEEAAISALVAAGPDEYPTHIAIYTSGNRVEFPCGMCRQSLWELAGENLQVIACAGESIKKKYMYELLPNAFSLSQEKY